jgi:hypothetical protein
MVLHQLEMLEKKNPELLRRKVERKGKGKKPRRGKDRKAENREELDEAEGFDVDSAEGPQTKEDINFHHEELEVLSQLALNRQGNGGPEDYRSIANIMNEKVASKTLLKVREREYTEQMIRDAYQYMIDRGWEPPAPAEKKAIEKGSSRSAGHRQSRSSRPVNEPSMAGSSGSHVQQQKLPTFMPPSQGAIIAFSGPPSIYSQQAKLPVIGSVVGFHGHQGPSQHTSLPGIGEVLGPHGHQGMLQQVNALAMIGTSSSQHLHAGAQHPSMHFPPPSSGQSAFHSLSDHQPEPGPHLPPNTEPKSGGNHSSSSHHHA